MFFTGGGIGASGDDLPISFGLGWSCWTGGRIAEFPNSLKDGGREGENFVGLRPDIGMPGE